MASWPSKVNVRRQFLLTFTAQCPARSPVSECQYQPGRFMSSGRTAASRAPTCNRRRRACSGRMPAFDPVLKKRSRPSCRKLLITWRSVSPDDTDGNSEYRGRHHAIRLLSPRLPCYRGSQRIGNPLDVESAQCKFSALTNSAASFGAHRAAPDQRMIVQRISELRSHP